MITSIYTLEIFSPLCFSSICTYVCTVCTLVLASSSSSSRGSAGISSGGF